MAIEGLFSRPYFQALFSGLLQRPPLYGPFYLAFPFARPFSQAFLKGFPSQACFVSPSFIGFSWSLLSALLLLALAGLCCQPFFYRL